MQPLFDVWPWNTAPGMSFLVLYAVLFALLVVTASIVAWAIAAHAERSGSPRAEPGGRDPYRIGGARRRFDPGSLPEGEEVWAIALLSGGERRLAETILAAGVGAGLVNANVRAPMTAPAGTVLGQLHGVLGGATAPANEARAAAKQLASRIRPWLEALLVNAGHLRGRALVRQMRAVIGGALAVALFLGIVRCARALTLHHPFGFLVVEMVVASIIAAGIAMQMEVTTARGRRYLRWLAAATTSVRAGVKNGREASVSAIARMVALEGSAPLAGLPMFVAVAPAVFWTEPQVSAFGGSCGTSGSMCGSASSCGSGGGCGG